jgi:hypothetical protein
MGHRPAEVEPVVNEKLSRPAELVQRAKQLAQLTNFQFGKNAVQTFNEMPAMGAGAPATVAQSETPRKTTEQKIEEAYGVKQIGSEVVFAARFENARRVQIAGDFNGWSQMSTPLMSNGDPSKWVTKLPLLPGRYRYRFIVDGRWVNDPHNVRVETNEYGELNNVVEVA